MSTTGADKISRNKARFEADAPRLRKPDWIRVKLPSGNAVATLKERYPEASHEAGEAPGWVEAIVGVMYLAIIISRLVGLYAAGAEERREQLEEALDRCGLRVQLQL